MTADVCDPGGDRRRRRGRGRRSVAVVVGRSGPFSATAIVLSDARMPCPSDVPRSGVRRLIAASTVAWSLVGAWTDRPASLKATTPTITPGGWRSTKSSVAALAASIRVGFRSSAAMLPETSKARMTVPSARGRLDRSLRTGQRDHQDGRARRRRARPGPGRAARGAAGPSPGRGRGRRGPGPGVVAARGLGTARFRAGPARPRGAWSAR